MLEVFERLAGDKPRRRISAEPHRLPHGLGGRRTVTCR
jgi:hypothetical protein